ncbi:hypothetical protein PIB30_078007 [Stylosanthes scabra]|uniref:Uncharacterized protein n=1 Tax=Stylosanthes scabra TaxID=79078 RepID=A0ABU6YNB7_9FABA|nr:hypothetical protein [Stylosanthes scabra]
MALFSSTVKFDVEKFDRRMFFGLWQVQVNDILIQSRLHKMRKVWAYCPGGASSAKGSEVAYVASLAEGYDDILWNVERYILMELLRKANMEVTP